MFAKKDARNDEPMRVGYNSKGAGLELTFVLLDSSGLFLGAAMTTFSFDILKN